MAGETLTVPNFSREVAQSVLYDLIDKTIDLDRQIIGARKEDVGKNEIKKLRTERDRVLYAMLELREGRQLSGIAATSNCPQ